MNATAANPRASTPAGRGQDFQHLPGMPWSLRPATGSSGRAALEIYHAGSLLDVMVAPSLAPAILRGARCAVWAGARCAVWTGEPCAVAWGCLPADGRDLSVTFSAGRVRPRPRAAEVISIAGWFWIALADGRLRSVTVTHGGTRERCRMRAVRPRS
jgi:hypothetical protein